MRFTYMAGLVPATLVALAACATSGGANNPATGTTDPNAPAGPVANVGRAIPNNPDTTHAPPSGVGNSPASVGTGTASLGAGVHAGASNESTPGMGANSFQLGSDAHIVSAVDIVNTDEIAEGMLARQRGTLPKVRAFADRMVQEHTMMQTMDRKLASQAAFVAGDTAQMALQMKQRDHDALIRLQQAPAGAVFDAQYISDQVQDHQNALNLLKLASQQARDSQVKSLVDASISHVQQHLDEAKAIQASLTAPAQ